MQFDPLNRKVDFRLLSVAAAAVDCDPFDDLAPRFVQNVDLAGATAKPAPSVADRVALSVRPGDVGSTPVPS